MDIKTGQQQIERARQNMPVLASISKDFVLKAPLKNIIIGCCLHLTSETAVLLETLQAGGATIVVCASNPLSTNDDVVAVLKEKGITVYGKRGETIDEYNKGLLNVVTQRPKILIDDGGDLTRMAHKTLFEDELPFGGLEETTTGINVIRQMEKKGKLKYPIIAVNDTRVKNLFDNHFGTGQSTLDGIIRATNVLLAGKTMVIAGYGHCGSGLASRARGMGCNVIITEVDPVKALQAKMDGFRVMEMLDAASEGDIFVTVTGNKDVITNSHMQHMKPEVILANAGHFDVEIDVAEAKRLRLNILGEGRLVNLVCAEGHPSEVMDMSFAAQALCTEYLVNHHKELAIGVHNVFKDIDDKIAGLKLASYDIKIDLLTDEQKEYYG